MKEMAAFQLVLARVSYANICTLSTLLHSLTVFRGGMFSTEHQENDVIQGSALC